MRCRTEDLLTVRDGEPMDAGERARLLDDFACAAEIERMRGIRDGLRGLPSLDPPRDVWWRVAARARKHERARSRRELRWLGAAVVAVAAVAAAILALPRSTSLRQSTGSEARESSVASHPGTAPSYDALVARSARLEQALARIPSRDSVVSAGTASTIAELEDRIAVVDEQLSYGAAGRLEPRQQQALWSERVDLMDALVRVRFAQAVRVGF